MRHNGSQLVIRDFPFFQWTFGILFAGVGILILTQGGPTAFGAIFAAFGVAFLLFSMCPDHHRRPDDRNVAARVPHGIAPHL